MPDLQIRLLGSPSILHDQQPVTGFVSSKATALVYYLAATNRTHSRDSLAALLWADVPDARAKKNLRDILSNLRKVMGDHLDITRQTVALTAPAETVDVTQFDALVAASGQNASSQQQTDSLTRAAALQSGEFLEGFYVSDAPIYEEWVLSERERLGQLGLQILNELITSTIHSGSYTEGINYALRSLALAPLDEAVHRQLMTIYVANGQYVAALEQYEQCCQLLYDEFGAEPSAETTGLFESIQNRQENPIASQIREDHLLPFVGRAHEVAEINRLLASSDCRLLTLVGLGGVGKSRLARQVAIRNEHRYLDGTYLIEMRPQHSAEQLVTDITSAIRLPIAPSTSEDEESISQLLDYLRTKSMLLIVDNAEFLRPAPSANIEAEITPQSQAARGAINSIDLLSMISSSAPSVQIIATSREQLGLRSEWLFEVGGLAIAPSVASATEMGFPKSNGDSNTAPVSELLQSDAIQLFLKRGRQVWADFPQDDDEISKSDLAAICSICQLVDGMPLAIELAASWVPMLSCREIRDEVFSGMELLASTTRDLPERHRSLQAVFDHSWQLLDPTEQEVLKKLSVFERGFNRKAAQQIAGATLSVLQNLMQRSFLTRTGGERFCLHNLLQQYAYQHLSKDRHKLLEAQEGHARYFSYSLLQHQNAFLAEQTELISTFVEDEGNNIRAAFDWAVENGQTELLDQMVDGVYQIYIARSWLAEGVSRFKSAATVFQNDEVLVSNDEIVAGKLQIRLGLLLQLSGRQEDAQTHLADGLRWTDAADLPLEKALCFLGQANMYHERADYAKAEEAGQQSLAIYRQHRNQRGEARSHLTIGKIRLAIGEYDAARQNLTQTLSLAQVLQLRSTEAECLSVLGQVCWNQGEHGTAKTYFEEALAIFRLPQMTNLLSEAKVLNELGFVAWSQGQTDQAQEYHEQARRTFHRIGNRQGEGNSLSHLGRVAERHRNYAEAERLYEQALVLNRALQDRQGEAISISNLGFVAYRRYDYVLAERHFVRCQELCQTIGFRRYEALAIACRGLLACFRRDYATGANLARSAIEMAQQIQDPVMEAYGWIHLGYALTADAEWGDVADAYERGLVLRRSVKDTERLLDPLSGLAYVALQQGDFEVAQRYADEILLRLNKHTLPSALFSGQIHYVCYCVLIQHGEPEAEHYLGVARRRMQEYRSKASLKSDEGGYLGEPLIHESLKSVLAG